MDERRIVLPLEIASLLIEFDVLKPSDLSQGAHRKQVILNDDCRDDLLCGHSVALLLHRVGIRVDIASSFAFENLSRNDNKYSSASAVFNWSNLVDDLKQHKVVLDDDTKLLIIAGDWQCIVQILKRLHLALSAAQKQKEKNSNRLNPLRKNASQKSLQSTEEITVASSLSFSRTNNGSSQSNASLTATTQSITQSTSATLPRIRTASKQHYALQHRPLASNRFFKLLCESFAGHFAMSATDAQRCLLSDQCLLSLFHEFALPHEISRDGSKVSTLSAKQLSTRRNLLAFLHERKAEMSKFVAQHSAGENSNVARKSMSHKSHNAVKAEMVYLLEVLSFGLVGGLNAQRQQTHLAVVFNAVSTMHAVLRSMHSMSAVLLEDVAEWMLNDRLFALLLECVASLELDDSIDSTADIIADKDSRAKLDKMLALLGYEVWNVLCTLSANKQSITLLSIFDTYCPRHANHLAVLLNLLKLLQRALELEATRKTFAKHLQTVVQRLQSERVLDFLISSLSSHLFTSSSRTTLMGSPTTTTTQANRDRIRLRYERMLNSAENSERPTERDPIESEADGDMAKGIACLSVIWRTLPLSLEMQQKDTLLSMLNKLSRSTSRPTQIACLAALFDILRVLATHQDADFTPRLYKLLIFHLVENHGDDELRDVMLSHFIALTASTPTIPIAVLVEPLVRQTAFYGARQLHLDLFNALATHTTLELKQAMLLIHLVGKLCVESLKYHVSAIGVLCAIVRRFEAEAVLRAYAAKLCQVLFSRFVEMAQEQHLAHNELPARKHELIDKMEATMQTLSAAAKLGLAWLTECVARILKSVVRDYAELFGHVHPLLKILHTTLSRHGASTDATSIDTARVRGGLHITVEEHEHDGLSPPAKVADDGPTTPEIASALRHAKQKYLRSLEHSATGSSSSSSVESSEMSEFAPDVVDTVPRAIRDIAAYREKKIRSRSVSPSPSRKKLRAKRKKRERKALAEHKTSPPILKKIGISRDLRRVQREYRHIFTAIAENYKGRVPTAIRAQSFDDMGRMKGMLSLGEFCKLFEDYAVCPALIDRNHLLQVLRESAGDDFGGNMCSVAHLMDALCFIAQTVELKDHSGAHLSPAQKLRNLIFYIKLQHETKRMSPRKLWQQRPPPLREVAQRGHKRRAKTRSPRKQSVKKQRLASPPSHKLAPLQRRSPKVDKIVDRHSKTKKKRSKSPSKFFQEFYQKGQIGQKVTEKYDTFKAERGAEEARRAEIKEIRRQRRCEELRKKLGEMQSAKREEREGAAIKLAEHEKENARHREEERQRRVALRKRKKEKIEAFKQKKVADQQRMRAREEQRENKNRVKLSRQDSERLVQEREKEIKRVADKKRRRDAKAAEAKKKEEAKKKRFEGKRKRKRKVMAVLNVVGDAKAKGQKGQSMVAQERKKKKQQMVAPDGDDDAEETWTVTKETAQTEAMEQEADDDIDAMEQEVTQPATEVIEKYAEAEKEENEQAKDSSVKTDELKASAQTESKKDDENDDAEYASALKSVKNSVNSKAAMDKVKHAVKAQNEENDKAKSALGQIKSAVENAAQREEQEQNEAEPEQNQSEEYTEHEETDDHLKERKALVVGSKVELFSASHDKWFTDGTITRVFADDEGDWLAIRYDGDRNKDVQRYSEHLRLPKQPDLDQEDKAKAAIQHVKDAVAADQQK